MIDRARRKAEQAGQQIDFRVGDAASLDCPDEAFDLVVARHVIWNLPNPQQGVAEWLRVLIPEGRLALIEGKWANNEALALANSRPTSRILARVIDAAAALILRSGRYLEGSSTGNIAESRCSCRFLAAFRQPDSPNS